MQIASKQVGFGSEHSVSMRQHDHYPEGDDNDEAQGIDEIITDLAQSASEKERYNLICVHYYDRYHQSLPKQNRGDGKGHIPKEE